MDSAKIGPPHPAHFLLSDWSFFGGGAVGMGTKGRLDEAEMCGSCAVAAGWPSGQGGFCKLYRSFENHLRNSCYTVLLTIFQL